MRPLVALFWVLAALAVLALAGWWGVAWVSDEGRVARELAGRQTYLRSLLEPLRLRGAKYEEVRAFLRARDWADSAWQSYPGEGGAYPPLVFYDERQALLINRNLGPQNINHRVTLRFGPDGRLKEIEIKESWLGL